MGTYFEIIHMILTCVILYACERIHKKCLRNSLETEIFLKNLVSAMNDNAEKLRYMQVKIDTIIDQQERFRMALVEPSQTSEPMKSNNWDSVRKAFRGPSRVDLNERD